MSQLGAARCNKSILTNLDQLHRFKREVCEVFEVGVAEAHLWWTASLEMDWSTTGNCKLSKLDDTRGFDCWGIFGPLMLIQSRGVNLFYHPFGSGSDPLGILGQQVSTRGEWDAYANCCEGLEGTPAQAAGTLWTSVDICHPGTLAPSTDDSGGPLICCYVDDVNGVEVVHRSSKWVTWRLKGHGGDIVQDCQRSSAASLCSATIYQVVVHGTEVAELLGYDQKNNKYKATRQNAETTETAT